ncbi:unnamed protein product [Nezara viridula]|uniref:Lipocalin/cytosolic fatty-acid binding domain-containing protein n=1 Tax=Nezara viridula TaxID=85310 RepID=A0A9P0HMX3_NEZVI|nr:unnamed protein product [Nezara viridula]
MTDQWDRCTKERSYRSTTSNKYTRTCIILFLFAFCITSKANNFHDLELQENFNPKKFFTGIWYETQRLNKTLTNWGSCLKIESSVVLDKIQFTTSAYIPFLFSRKSFKSSTKLGNGNKPNFLVSISALSWNISVISTDYDNYALASSRSINKSLQSSTSAFPEIMIIFRRNKNDKGHVQEIENAAVKSGISYHDLSVLNC